MSARYHPHSGLDSGGGTTWQSEDSGGSGPTPPVQYDLLSGIIRPWMERPKRAQSFVGCGEKMI